MRRVLGPLHAVCRSLQDRMRGHRVNVHKVTGSKHATSRDKPSKQDGNRSEGVGWRRLILHTRLKAAQASKSGTIVGVARHVDASIYRDTFPAIRIAILFFTTRFFFS